VLALKSFRDARPGLPDLLNWGFLVADGVVLCKDGSLLAGWLYEGPDLDASPDSQLNWVSEQMNAALARLSGGWSIWVDANRLPSPTYFDPSHSSFPDPVSQLIEDERRGHFLSLGRHYETEYALLVHYMPPLRSKGRLLNLIYSPGQEGGSAADAILSGFERTITDLEDSLSNVVRTRRMRDFVELDVTGREQTRSHLVNYLNFILTGNELSLNLPHCGFYLDSILGSVDFEPGDTPRVGDSYVAVVSIRGFPEQSVPGILAVLDVMSLPLRYSSRFIFIDQPEAHRQITSIERKWKQRLRGFWADVLKLPAPRVDEDALQMTEQASSALGRTNSGLVGTGYFTPVVTLMAATPEEAIENARAVRREIRKLGFNAEIDTINATEAWLGSLPGHTVPNVRRPPMHTDNLADLLPLTSVWTGRPTNPCPYYPPNSPALLQAATSGAAPFWLNLHSGDIAHTLIFGPTGAGKSTLQAMIMAQALRYPGMTIWAFDKGKSSMPIAKACGGRYYDVTTGGELQFCPLSVLDGDGDVAWAEEYIAVCYELQHGAPPTPLNPPGDHADA